MAKFLHSSLLDNIKKNSTLWSSNAWTNAAKKILMIADDYHILLNGVDHKTIGTVQGGLKYTNGTLEHSNTVAATNTNEFRPIKIDAQGHISGYGDAITPLVSSNIVDFVLSNGKSGTDEKKITFDPDGTNGKTVKLEGGTNKFTITDTAAGGVSFDVNITPSITGGTTTAPTSGKVISTISISTAGVPSVASSTNVADLVLGGYTANTSASVASIANTSTLNYALNALKNEIDTVKGTATGAMTFKGTASALPTGTPVNGDTYKVTTAFDLAAANSTTGALVKLAIGDTIVAVEQSDKSFKWAVIPSGDETFDTLEENTNGLSITVDGTTKAIKLTGKSFGSKDANTVFAAPSGGGEPTFRKIAEADIDSNGFSGSIIKSGTIGAAFLPNIGVGKLEGIVSVENGGTGKSSWEKGGLVYANDTTALAQVANLTAPSSGSSTGLLQQSITSSGTITYSYVDPGLVVADTATGTSNSNSGTQNKDAFINLLVGSTKKSGISVKSGTGIKVTYNSGAITIANTQTSNVDSAFAVASENKTIDGTSYSTAKLSFTEGSVTSNWNIVGLGATKVEYDDSNSNIKITSSNTWRDIQAYSISTTYTASRNAATTQASIGSGVLKFGEGLLATVTKNASNTITEVSLDIAWAEVDANGYINYV